MRTRDPSVVSSTRGRVSAVVACIFAGATTFSATPAEIHVPLLPAASATGFQGFVRVINHSEIPGEVAIDAFDDAGRWFGPVLLSVPAAGAVHFNADDLERGNAAKGLTGRTGSGAGDWRLVMSSALDVEALVYVRAPDGFLTAMNDVVPSRGNLHRVPVFNPGSNVAQRSRLRLVNPGRTPVGVAIEGVDDADASPGGPVRLSVAAGASRTVWADELETGVSSLDGALGDGVGKWRLTIGADGPIFVMGLLASPTGHITNLSGAPHRGNALVSAAAFRDALAEEGEGPEMVRIRDGSFRRGCLTGTDCRSDESPVQRVTLAQGFAISRHEITFADWEACVAGGGCNGYVPDDEGWGRGRRPVINVSWEDAEAYASWLSRSTGAEYRLPNEAEWEYAARAGTGTPYSWGEEVGQGRANCAEEHCRDGFPNTAPVGSFPANRWGLHDMHGNVQEWVQDCYDNFASYERAPTDGSAWEFDDCGRRMHRGGSWESSPPYLRAASRGRDAVEVRSNGLGFRVARSLRAGRPAVVPLFPLASDRGPQGFVRVINYSARAGDIRIDVYDDAGRAFGPLTLSLEPGATAYFNSEDLEAGNPDKGLSGGVGLGTSQWRLELSSSLDFEALSYLRTPDGFLTAMQDVAPALDDRHRIAIFNPGSNRSQRSVLRLINPGTDTARVVIEGVDDSGRSPGEPVRVSLPAGAARNLAAWELEEGGSGLRGALGDGAGKWRLSIESDRPILAVSVLESPTRHLTNLSGAPRRGLSPEVFDERISGDIVDGKCLGCHVVGGEAGDTRLVFQPSAVSNRRALNRRAFRAFLAEVVDGVGVLLRKVRGVDHDGGLQLREASRDYADLQWFLELLGEESLLGRRIGENAVDYDGDGMANPDDRDDDNDGVADTRDAFPGNASEWADTNGNGRGDNGEFLLAGRNPPRGPDPVEIAGEASLGAPLQGGRIDITAVNGSPIASTRTARDGSFSITLSEALLPDWFLVRASLGAVDQVSDDGQDVLEVANHGSFRAYVGKRHLDMGRLRVSPWTEIAFQEVLLRHPLQRGLPNVRDAAEILDGIAATFPDGGRYDSLVVDGVSSVTADTLEALERGIVSAILSGAGPNEIAKRVEMFRIRDREDGIVEAGSELRRVATVDGTRVLSVFSREDANDLPEVRQTYVTAQGALVGTRFSRLNETDSAVRVDVNHAGGRAISLSGRSEGLKDVRHNASWLEALAEKVVAVTPGSTGDELSLDIDKDVATAISDGQLLFQIDGSAPRSDALAIIRDDPVVEWDFMATGASMLDDDGVHRTPIGVRVRLLSNRDLLVMRFSRKADRDRFDGVDGTSARRALYLWLTEEIGAGRFAYLAGRPWVRALAGAYSIHGRAPPVRSALDPLEALRAGSRVHVSRRSPQAGSGIVPGREYGLEFVFDHMETGEQGDTGIRLKIDQDDALEYRIDVPYTQDDSPSSLLAMCEEAGYHSYSQGLDRQAGKYYCHRRDVERSSRSLGTVADLEYGFYWVVARQSVVFEPRPSLVRSGEMVAGAAMGLKLADDQGLHPRASRYEIDLGETDLHPAFDVLSDGTSLVLDARASVVGTPVTRDYVDYTWSHVVMESSGQTVTTGTRALPLLREQVRWQASVSKPVHVVALSDLGLDGERTEIWIRLEMMAQGRGATTTRLVSVDGDAWNRSIFDRVRQAADQAAGVDLRPAFRSGVGDLTLRVGTTMRPVRLPAASGGDGELTHSITSELPPGLRYSAGSRQVAGTPSRAGDWEIRYRAEDEDGDAAELRFGIRVLARDDPNSEPRLPEIENRSFRMGERVYWTLPAASAGDDPKSYDLQGTLPPGLRFDLGIRRLSGTTTRAGTYPLRYSVMDRDGDTDVERFTVTVLEEVGPPSAEGWIVGDWWYGSTHEGCNLRGDRLIEVAYQAGVYTVHTTGSGVDVQADADGTVACSQMSATTTLDLRGYPVPSDYGADDFLRMFHCGEHLGFDREGCDTFVFKTFSDEEVVVEETVGGVLSNYTYTKQAARIPRFR